MTIETRFSAARRPRASRSRSTVASRAIRRRLSARSRSSCALNGILYKWTKTINDIVKKLSARPPTFSICYRDQQKVRRPRRPFEPSNGRRPPIRPPSRFKERHHSIWSRRDPLHNSRSIDSRRRSRRRASYSHSGPIHADCSRRKQNLPVHSNLAEGKAPRGGVLLARGSGKPPPERNGDGF